MNIKLLWTAVAIAVVFGAFYAYSYYSRTDTVSTARPHTEVSIKGSYRFEEVAESAVGSNQAWIYDLQFSEESDGKIDLSIDGFQTMVRIHALGSQSQGSLDVVFESYAPGNMSTLFKKGDVLFTLMPTSEGLVIEWKTMRPMLEKNRAGSTFYKVANESEVLKN